jgi:hypothetical protein
MVGQQQSEGFRARVADCLGNVIAQLGLGAQPAAMGQFARDVWRVVESLATQVCQRGGGSAITTAPGYGTVMNDIRQCDPPSDQSASTVIDVGVDRPTRQIEVTEAEETNGARRP